MTNHHAIAFTLTASLALVSCREEPQRLLLDVHHLKPGTVKLEDVAEAHRTDLAVEDEHDVHYQRYWLDETSGTVMVTVRALDTTCVVVTSLWGEFVVHCL